MFNIYGKDKKNIEEFESEYGKEYLMQNIKIRIAEEEILKDRI